MPLVLTVFPFTGKHTVNSVSSTYIINSTQDFVQSYFETRVIEIATFVFNTSVYSDVVFFEPRAAGRSILYSENLDISSISTPRQWIALLQPTINRLLTRPFNPDVLSLVLEQTRFEK